MGRNPDLAQPGHQIFGDPVVEHPLAGDGALLLVVERGRVVLEILNQSARLGSLEQDLRLALIDLSAARHGTPVLCWGKRGIAGPLHSARGRGPQSPRAGQPEKIRPLNTVLKARVSSTACPPGGFS